MGAGQDAEETPQDDLPCEGICRWRHSHQHRGSAFSLLKRGIVGTWHKVSAKYLPAYLDEMCFRFNNRKNPFLFRDTIIKLVQTAKLEYKELTAQPAESAA